MSIREPETFLTLTVAATNQVADDVVELELRDPSGADLPEWLPGSHIDVLAGDIVRQYSLSGSRTDRGVWRVAVLLESGGRGGSRWIHGLTPGDRISVAGLRNHFALEDAPEYLFIAGGIGITPIVPMIESVAATGKPWQLVHIGRNEKRLPYSAEIEARHPGHVRRWFVEASGRPSVGDLISQLDPRATVYCCGPEEMMREAESQGTATGIDVRVERFVPKAPAADAGGDHPFEVELVESGMTLVVPADRTILDVVTEAGVPVLSSCAEGTCGSCETEVVDGLVDHRDSILSEAEQKANQVMFVCCSRAQGDRLVLRL